MERTTALGRVTNSTGNIDSSGDLVGSLVERIGTARDPGRYVERPGLAERIEKAGADVGAVRRMLGVPR